MIAYFAAIVTALDTVITHKLGVNHDEDAVLFVDEGLYKSRDTLENTTNLAEYKIFTDVIPLRLFVPKNMPDNVPIEKAEQAVVDFFDDLFKKCKYNIEDFKEIIVTNDSWGGDINLYLNLKKLQYTWLQLYKNSIPPFVHENLNRCFTEAHKKYKSLTPFAEYAYPCLIDTADISQNAMKNAGKEYKVWSKENCYNELSDKDIILLGKCFRLDEFDFIKEKDQSDVLIIKNSYGFLTETVPAYAGEIVGLKQYSREQIFSVMDKVSIDFYAPDENKIYLKSHIHDPILLSNAKKLYDDNTEVLPNIPFEIMGKYFSVNKIKFDSIIGAMSLSLDVINSEHCNNFFHLGLEFAKTWWMYISIYTSFLFAKECVIKKIYADKNIKREVELLAKKTGYEIEAVELNPAEIPKIKDSMIIIDMCSNINANIEKSDQSTVVAFLNDTLCDKFYDFTDSEMLVPLIVKKDMISEMATDILYHKERVWIYSKDTETRRAARKFKYERELKNLGMKIHVDGITLGDAIYEYRQTYDRYAVHKLKTHINNLENELEHTKEFIRNNCDIKALLLKTNDIEQYLDIISLLPHRYALFMTVRDTPGSKMTDSVLSKVKKLGFFGFERTMWKMYIGISACGNTVCDTAAEKTNVPIEYTYIDIHSGDRFDLKSEPWKNGNQAVISINGIDYSANIRGINIVVYDIEEKKAVDSVGYDAHGSTDGVFRRKNF